MEYKTKKEDKEKTKVKGQEKKTRVIPPAHDNLSSQSNRSNQSFQREKIANSQRNKLPERGIQTMFRISSSNSLKISEMADNKAHIMISVNSIIISVILGLVVRTIDENRNLVVPTVILLSVSVVAIIYSILATRPKILSGVFTQKQVEDKSVNLLFFGSFYKMGFKEYQDAMLIMMQDDEFLYGSLIKDIYWQGKVLGRKYKFLNISYSVFMYGIIASVIAFTVAGFF